VQPGKYFHQIPEIFHYKRPPYLLVLVVVDPHLPLMKGTEFIGPLPVDTVMVHDTGLVKAMPLVIHQVRIPGTHAHRMA
jgi:hypothetical protein